MRKNGEKRLKNGFTREMRRRVIVAVLEKAGEVAVTSADLFEAFLTAGYGASVSRLEYTQRGIRYRREKNKAARERKRKFMRFMYEMRRMNLIAMDEKGEIIVRTNEGDGRLKEARMERVDYEGSVSATYTVVVFDVPQIEKKKRDWIREALRNMGFMLIQKSVWAGKIKLPEDFVENLFHLEMENYVHIFEAENEGTLALRH